MPARRTLVVLAVLLAALGIAAALDAAGRDDGRTATRPAPSPGADLPPSRTIVATIPAASRAPRTVRARVGDLVKLTIASRAAGTVTLDGYDRSEPVEAGTPARFSLIVQRAGSFPVRVRRSAVATPGPREGPQGRWIGLLVVGEAARRE